MENLIDKVSKELEDRLSVESETKTAMSTFQTQADNSMKRVKETTDLANRVQTEITTNREMLSVLKSKNEEMQNTFEQIDQLETIVNRVKETYNSVANNLDQMERAISASMSNTSFGLGKKSDTTIQPYFPPPGHVDIYDTNELFEPLSRSK